MILVIILMIILEWNLILFFDDLDAIKNTTSDMDIFLLSCSNNAELLFEIFSKLVTLQKNDNLLLENNYHSPYTVLQKLVDNNKIGLDELFIPAVVLDNIDTVKFIINDSKTFFSSTVNNKKYLELNDYIAEHNKIEILRIFIDAGIDINVLNCNLLRQSISFGHLEMVDLILDHDPNINCIDYSLMVKNPIILSKILNETYNLDIYLDVNIGNSLLKTSLLSSFLESSLLILEYIRKTNNINLFALKHCFYNAIQCVLNKGNSFLPIVEQLLEFDIDKNFISSSSYIKNSLESNNFDLFKILLNGSVEIFLEDKIFIYNMSDKRFMDFYRVRMNNKNESPSKNETDTINA